MITNTKNIYTEKQNKIDTKIIDYVFNNAHKIITDRGTLLVSDKYVAVESDSEVNFKNYIHTNNTTLLVGRVDFFDIEFNIYKRDTKRSLDVDVFPVFFKAQQI